MENSGQLGLNLRGIGHMLRDQSLEVPPYQRNYSWEKEQLDEYWFDLLAALTSDLPFYFLGTVVIGSSKPGIASVIDGQQRLATTSMLLAAIRDEFKSRGDSSRSETIQSRYLAASSLVENRTLPKLTLNRADQAFFEKIVLNLGPVPGLIVDEREEIKNAFQRIRAHLKGDIESAGPRWEERLIRWVDLIDRKAQVIAVTVADDADAFLIFETLNDRGLELSVADLIKNYLLGLSRTRIESAQEIWVATNQTIEAAANSKELTNYIRQWWSSQNGATRERDLYRALQKQVRSEDRAIAALTALSESASDYAALLDPEHNIWSDYPPVAPAAVALLLEFGLEQYRPLALATMRNLDHLDVADTLEAILNWSIRGIIGGGIGGGTAERIYAEAAVRVSNGRAKGAMDIYREVEQIVATDSEFRAAFETRRILRTSYLRYLLRAIASDHPYNLTKFTDAIPVGLFPRTDPNGEWDHLVTEDERVQMSARLGNFGLIRSTDAVNIPTEPQARLLFVAEFDKLPGSFRDRWTSVSFETIEARQQLMADRATQIWGAVPPNRHSVA